MAGYIKVISSLLLVYIVSLNTTNENKRIVLDTTSDGEEVSLNTTNWNRKITNKNKEITDENKGHGQICLTWGGINSVCIVGILNKNPASLLYLLRFSPEYKYFFNRYLGIVPRFGVLDGWYHNGANACFSILSLGLGLEWSYNGTGSNSRINNTYYGGSIAVLGLWGNTIGSGNKLTLEPNKWGVQVRLTPFKMCKPNGFYMSVDFGTLDIRGLMGSGWFDNGIVIPTVGNLAFNIGWSWWI